ncbi:MAG: PTS fructose transporter subunit IIA [Candidatus Dadabacteria bacterium]|nr:PTS fructose transporter subunit IIA [Candidatus Dadabacteria bacterium]NIT13705.1 PTS fructose transporter subunit IIA [Candidatus Dadabacteria bacterium]
MIGIVVISHGNFADELISAVNFVLSGKPAVKIVGINLGGDVDFEAFKKEIKRTIKKVDNGNGVLLVTDMFGGTPSNISLTFLEENQVEVISGVNLPMLIKLATLPGDTSLSDAVKIAEKAGRDNIIVASNLIKN